MERKSKGGEHSGKSTEKIWADSIKTIANYRDGEKGMSEEEICSIAKIALSLIERKD
ncbi:hypothetical protein [Peribacillus muralis]|uniref:hypothetical protein n=1 Tax=Peribacillus muralis TaxID=264697 RepID=UPI000A8A1104